MSEGNPKPSVKKQKELSMAEPQSTFIERSRQAATLTLRRDVQRWNLWQCEIPTLRTMHAEIEQEMHKLAANLKRAESEFRQLVEAGDPIGAEESREAIRALGDKWDDYRRMGHEIDVILRERRLNGRIQAVGRYIGFRALDSWLQVVRAVALGLSLLATFLPLVGNEVIVTDMLSWDEVNLICSLLLTFDFFVRLTAVTERRQYFADRAGDIFLALPLTNLVLALGAAPFGFATQIARAITLLRFGRFFRILLGERLHLRSISFLRSVQVKLVQRVILIGGTLLVVGTYTINALERSREAPGLFSDRNETLWWGIKIALTGNVDANPESALGKLLTLLMILVGLAVGGVVIATITSILVDSSDERNGLERQQQEIADRLVNMEANLDLLTNAKQAAGQAAAEIAQMTLNDSDRQAVFDNLTQRLVERFGCRQASVHLFEDITRDLLRVTIAGDEAFAPPLRTTLDGNQTNSLPSNLHSNLLGRAAGQARSGVLDALPRLEIEPLPLADGGAIAIPLTVRRIGYGVLHVVVPQAWLRDDFIRQLLGLVACQLAIFISDHTVTTVHADLLESIADLQIAMERVTMTHDYNALLFTIAEGANALLNADMTKVMLLRPETDILYGVAWHGMTEAMGQRLQTRIGQGLTGLSAKVEKPVKSSNLLTDQRVEMEGSQARQSGMRSELCVPIRARGSLLGVLSVMSSQHKRFSKEEETLLGTLAGQAGAAIENARVYASEVRRSANNLNVDLNAD